MHFIMQPRLQQVQHSQPTHQGRQSTKKFQSMCIYTTKDNELNQGQQKKILRKEITGESYADDK